MSAPALPPGTPPFSSAERSQTCTLSCDDERVPDSSRSFRALPHHETASCSRITEPCGRPLADAAGARTVARYGFLDDLMDKLDGARTRTTLEGKMMREQQAILASRRASGGFITEAQEEEIRQRRAKVGEEKIG